MIKDYQLPPGVEVLGFTDTLRGSPIHSMDVDAKFEKYDLLQVHFNVVCDVNSSSRYFYWDLDSAGTFRGAYDVGGLDDNAAATSSGGYSGGSFGILGRSGWNSNCYVSGSSFIYLNEGVSGIVQQTGNFYMEKSATYVMSGSCGSRFIPTSAPTKPATLTIGLEGATATSFYGDVLVLGRLKVLEGF